MHCIKPLLSRQPCIDMQRCDKPAKTGYFWQKRQTSSASCKENRATWF